jgi:hypothetical protein
MVLARAVQRVLPHRCGYRSKFERDAGAQRQDLPALLAPNPAAKPRYFDHPTYGLSHHRYHHPRLDDIPYEEVYLLRLTSTASTNRPNPNRIPSSAKARASQHQACRSRHSSNPRTSNLNPEIDRSNPPSFQHKHTQLFIWMIR